MQDQDVSGMQDQDISGMQDQINLFANGPPSPSDTILLHAQKICFLLNNVDKKEKNDNANIETFDPIPKN